MGGPTPCALRPGDLDPRARATHGPRPKDDPQGAALRRPAALPALARPSKLDPFKDEIHRLLRAEPTLPATRIREEIELLGFDGRQTTVDVYVREVRPLFAPPPRSFQRTHYRAGEICQFDLWRPAKEIPVGFGQTRPGYVVIACLGYSRVGAAALVFSKEAPDLLWGIRRCLWRLGGLPKTIVWDREGALHAGGRASIARACRLLRRAQARLVAL